MSGAWGRKSYPEGPRTAPGDEHRAQTPQGDSPRGVGRAAMPHHVGEPQGRKSRSGAQGPEIDSRRPQESPGDEHRAQTPQGVNQILKLPAQPLPPLPTGHTTTSNFERSFTPGGKQKPQTSSTAPPTGQTKTSNFERSSTPGGKPKPQTTKNSEPLRLCCLNSPQELRKQKP